MSDTTGRIWTEAEKVEWTAAELILSSFDAQQQKNGVKISRADFSGDYPMLQHSFIYVDGELYRMSSKVDSADYSDENKKNIYQEKSKYHLGFGGFAKVKWVENKAGKKFAVKIVDAKELEFTPDEQRIMQICGIETHSFTRKHTTGKVDWHLGAVDNKHYIFQPIISGVEFTKGYEYSGIEEDETYLPPTIKPVSTLPAIQRRQIAMLAMLDMYRFHKKNIILGDAKTKNLMVDIRGDNILSVRHIDFGLATVLPAGEEVITCSPAGTEGYMAPEIKREGSFSFKSDVYALGVICQRLKLNERGLDDSLIAKMLLENPAERTTLIDAIIYLCNQLSVAEVIAILPALDKVRFPDAAEAIVATLVGRKNVAESVQILQALKQHPHCEITTQRKIDEAINNLSVQHTDNSQANLTAVAEFTKLYVITQDLLPESDKQWQDKYAKAQVWQQALQDNSWFALTAWDLQELSAWNADLRNVHLQQAYNKQDNSFSKLIVEFCHVLSPEKLIAALDAFKPTAENKIIYDEAVAIIVAEFANKISAESAVQIIVGIINNAVLCDLNTAEKIASSMRGLPIALLLQILQEFSADPANNQNFSSLAEIIMFSCVKRDNPAENMQILQALLANKMYAADDKAKLAKILVEFHPHTLIAMLQEFSADPANNQNFSSLTAVMLASCELRADPEGNLLLVQAMIQHKQCDVGAKSSLMQNVSNLPTAALIAMLQVLDPSSKDFVQTHEFIMYAYFASRHTPADYLTLSAAISQNPACTQELRMANSTLMRRFASDNNRDFKLIAALIELRSQNEARVTENLHQGLAMIIAHQGTLQKNKFYCLSADERGEALALLTELQCLQVKDADNTLFINTMKALTGAELIELLQSLDQEKFAIIAPFIIPIVQEKVYVEQYVLYAAILQHKFVDANCQQLICAQHLILDSTNQHAQDVALVAEFIRLYAACDEAFDHADPGDDWIKLQQKFEFIQQALASQPGYCLQETDRQLLPDYITSLQHQLANSPKAQQQPAQPAASKEHFLDNFYANPRPIIHANGYEWLLIHVLMKTVMQENLVDMADKQAFKIDRKQLNDPEFRNQLRKNDKFLAHLSTWSIDIESVLAEDLIYNHSFIVMKDSSNPENGYKIAAMARGKKYTTKAALLDSDAASIVTSEGLLGAGAFGVVKSVLWEDGSKSAIKIKLASDDAHKEFENLTKVKQAKTSFTRADRKQTTPWVSGSIQAKYYIVTELQQGATLTKYLADNPRLAIPERLLLAHSVATAISEQVHFNGLIHRDLKPENLKITVDPVQIKVIDFGDAIEYSAETPKSKTSSIVGTANYIAPEIAQYACDAAGNVICDTTGRPSSAPIQADCEYSIQSDVYAFGRILQNDLFPGLLKKPATELTDAEQQIVALIKSTTSFDPSTRPSNMTEVLSQLAAIPSFPAAMQIQRKAIATKVVLTTEQQTELASKWQNLMEAKQAFEARKFGFLTEDRLKKVDQAKTAVSKLPTEVATFKSTEAYEERVKEIGELLLMLASTKDFAAKPPGRRR